MRKYLPGARRRLCHLRGEFQSDCSPAFGGSVEFAIGVKVSDNDAMRMRVRVDVDGRAGRKMKASTTIAKEDAQIGRLVVGDD